MRKLSHAHESIFAVHLAFRPDDPGGFTAEWTLAESLVALLCRALWAVKYRDEADRAE